MLTSFAIDTDCLPSLPNIEDNDSMSGSLSWQEESIPQELVVKVNQMKQEKNEIMFREGNN